MTQLSLKAMRAFLSKSLSSINKNKLNGVRAEAELRNFLHHHGLAGHVLPGGWIARSDSRAGAPFGANTVAFFPHAMQPTAKYSSVAGVNPPPAFHKVGAIFHGIGISTYYLHPIVTTRNDPFSISWYAFGLGPPVLPPPQLFPGCIPGFAPRTRRHNYLRYKSKTAALPAQLIRDEFSRESARVSFSSKFFSEIVDVDALFWGKHKVYPIEIKEKTAANDKAIGDWFGLDVSPFVKLSHYSARRGNLDALFIVREIDHESSRNLVGWWYVDFETLAKNAAWTPRGGGRDMRGGRSTVIRIPKAAFKVLDAAALHSL
jgi:hypothetical protein